MILSSICVECTSSHLLLPLLRLMVNLLCRHLMIILINSVPVCDILFNLFQSLRKCLNWFLVTRNLEGFSHENMTRRVFVNLVCTCSE